MTTPKTILIFLPGGDPQGIRIAEITTRIVQVVDVPRSLLGDFLKMPESERVALYFLIREGSDGEEPRVYVGQTGDVRSRLISHHQKKEFWQRALVLVSSTNSLTQTHALFLEWHSLQAVQKAGRYTVENGNSGSKPHTPAPLAADCIEVFETGRTLLATLGHPLFDALASAGAGGQAREVFHCKAAGIDGRGLLTPEGFVVLAGSRGRRANVPSIVGTSDERFRRKLVEAEVMREEGDEVVFPKDHLFSSPSAALIALLGRTANGWKEWKDAEGHSLDRLRNEPAS
jgi:hypothetical protein